MESNTAKAEAEAEARLMQEMEEEEALHNEVQEKKRQYLLMEKDRLVNELLDLQVRKSPFLICGLSLKIWLLVEIRDVLIYQPLVKASYTIFCRSNLHTFLSTNIIIFHQIAALTPVAETAKQFTKNYKSFATAVDTTRHELPVNNFYIDGDRREFLGWC